MRTILFLTTCFLATQALASAAGPNGNLEARTDAVRELVRGRGLPPLTQPCFDTDTDGRVWVRGGDYKASFDADGATYYPLFGSATPRHFPLKLALEGATSDGKPIELAAATQALRVGDRIEIDRGVIDEVYEASLAGLEQTFVVDRRPAGDLKLRVRLDTELAPFETPDGFGFANEYGKVLYGHAFVREADGAKHAVDSRLVEGGVEIQIPADYLASAQFPLVVDPFVGQFGLQSGTLDQRLGDIAYDSTNNRFLLAFEEAAAANDGDVRLIWIDGTGNNLSVTEYVDTSAEDWRLPSVGNQRSAKKFLVCASAGNVAPYNIPGLSFRMVLGRTVDASNPSAQSAKFFVVSSEIGLNNRYDVSVGGDETEFGTTNWLVTWEEAVSGGSRIYGRRISSTGVPVGVPLQISATAGSVRPNVSKWNGSSRWNVVWERNGDVYGAQVTTAGVVVTPEFAVANNSLLSEVDPHAASPFDDGSWAAVWQQSSGGGERDLYCKVFSGSTLVAERNVSASDVATQTLDQRMSSIDCDGERIAIAFAESKGGSTTDYDVYTSSYFSMGGQLRPSEIHAAISTSTSDASKPSITSTRKSGAYTRRFGLGYTLNIGSSAEMFGALYDLPEGGTIAPFCGTGLNTNSCPCSNQGGAGRGCANSSNSQGALLTGAGIASLAHDTVVLSGSGMTESFVLYFQGDNQPGMGVVFGDGVRCTVGSIIRLGVKANAGGASSIPSAGDASLSTMGLVTSPTTHTYQGWYRDAVSFCTAGTFNLTNAVFVVWSL